VYALLSRFARRTHQDFERVVPRFGAIDLVHRLEGDVVEALLLAARPEINFISSPVGEPAVCYVQLTHLRADRKLGAHGLEEVRPHPVAELLRESQDHVTVKCLSQGDFARKMPI